MMTEKMRMKRLVYTRTLDQLIISAYIRLEISRIRCAYYTTQFNFKLYIFNPFDSSSLLLLKMNQIDSKYTV